MDRARLWLIQIVVSVAEHCSSTEGCGSLRMIGTCAGTRSSHMPTVYGATDDTV